MIRMSTSNNNRLVSNLWFVTLGTLHMQAFRPPQALHPLTIHSIAIMDQNHVNTPISITRTVHCQSSDPFTQTQLRCATNRLMTLSTSILTNHHTHSTLRHPDPHQEPTQPPVFGLGSPFSLHSINPAIILNMSLSNSFSASNRFNSTLSCSKVLSRATSSGHIGSAILHGQT